MEVLLIASLAAIAAGVVFPLRDKGVRSRWKSLAQKMGLQYEPSRLLESENLAGSLGPYPVRIDNVRLSGTRVGVRVAVPSRARFVPRHLWFFEPGTHKDDMVEGIPDDLLRLIKRFGLSRVVLMLLDSSGESLLESQLYSAHIGLSSGELYLTAPHRIEHPEVLGVVLSALARFAEAVEHPERVAERLGENARDPRAPHRRRLQCFVLLMERYPSHSEVDRTAWALEASALDIDSADGFRMKVLAMQRSKSDTHLDFLERGLNCPLPNVRTAAVEALLALETDLALPRLLSAAKDTQPSVASAAIRLLPIKATPEDQAIERLLLDLLYRGNPQLRVDIVCCLGTVGSALAIGPLVDLERVSDSGIRRLCKYALGKLQARFPERTRGALSVLEEEGTLSEVETEGV